MAIYRAREKYRPPCPRPTETSERGLHQPAERAGTGCRRSRCAFRAFGERTGATVRTPGPRASRTTSARTSVVSLAVEGSTLLPQEGHASRLRVATPRSRAESPGGARGRRLLGAQPRHRTGARAPRPGGQPVGDDVPHPRRRFRPAPARRASTTSAGTRPHAELVGRA